MSGRHRALEPPALGYFEQGNRYPGWAALIDHLDQDHLDWRFLQGSGNNPAITHEALHGGSWDRADVERHP